MIRKPDGTPYTLKGSLQQYDKFNPAHDLLNRYDEEMIQISGTPIYYYEVMIQMQSVDPVYMEDRSKLFKDCYVKLWAFYEPPQQQNMSGLFAYDTPDEEIIFEMNHKAVLREAGGPLKVGSRIYTPHRGENWIIIDTRLDQFKLWSAVRLLVHCKKFIDTNTNNQGQVSEGRPEEPNI